jgi:stage II sporulation protein D
MRSQARIEQQSRHSGPGNIKVFQEYQISDLDVWSKLLTQREDSLQIRGARTTLYYREPDARIFDCARRQNVVAPNQPQYNLIRLLTLAILTAAAANAATWQAAVDAAMKGHPGTALVARVADGQIVAAWNRQLADNALTYPGSAVKPFTLAALIDAGVLPVKADWLCTGHLIIAGHNLACTHPKSAAPLDAAAALAYSCNQFFAHFAQAIPPDRLRTVLTNYGFDTTATDDPRLLALGEAAVRITPTRLLSAYCKLARARRDSRDSLQPIFQGMEASAEYGTARSAAIPNWRIAGKTGTGPEYGWFAGYAPADHPEWVFLVAVPRGSGSGDAAPLAHDILARYREVAPPGEVNVEGRRYALDDYVAGVLAGEAATYRTPQALRAMAIAARTYAVRFRGRHSAEGFDFCALTHCQSFKPADVTPAERDAADVTSGEFIWYRGSPAAAYYSQDCGGVLEAGGEPYLPSRPDDACTRKGRQQWSAEIPLADLTRAIGAPVRTIEILSRTPSGRAQSIRLDASRTLPATDFRLNVGRTLGWNLLRSDLYSVHLNKDRAIFSGHGAGHGIGLCQNGAEAMAQSGATDRDILASYYPGTAVGLTARGLRWHILSGERLDLWTTDDSQQRWIPIAESALHNAESRAGWSVTSRIKLMLFPSLETFRNATGDSGNILASTRGTVIRAQPTIDAPTIRHEIWHAVIESRVPRDIPDWFREGLALAMSDVEPRSPERTAARDRIRRLITQYGEKQVLAWAGGQPAASGVFAQ